MDVQYTSHMGVYLIGVHPIGGHLIGVHLIGVHFIGTRPCLRYTPVSEITSGAYLYVRSNALEARL
jgi:hypothetical protein